MDYSAMRRRDKYVPYIRANSQKKGEKCRREGLSSFTENVLRSRSIVSQRPNHAVFSWSWKLDNPMTGESSSVDTRYSLRVLTSVIPGVIR